MRRARLTKIFDTMLCNSAKQKYLVYIEAKTSYIMSVPGTESQERKFIPVTS